MGVWVVLRVDVDVMEVLGVFVRVKSEGGGERREEKVCFCGGVMGEYKFFGSWSCFYYLRCCFWDREILKDWGNEMVKLKWMWIRKYRVFDGEEDLEFKKEGWGWKWKFWDGVRG